MRTSYYKSIKNMKIMDFRSSMFNYYYELKIIIILITILFLLDKFEICGGEMMLVVVSSSVVTILLNGTSTKQNLEFLYTASTSSQYCKTHNMQNGGT